MNKKILTVGAAVVIGGTLMITSAFGAMSNTSAGYEAFKTAHKQAPKIDSLTTDAQFRITDGGQSLFDVQSKFKFNSNKTKGSGVINVTQNGETLTINGYIAQDQLVLKTSENDTYYVMEHNADHVTKDDHISFNPVIAENAERIIDAVIGLNRNYFQLKEGPENSSVVKLSMHDNEIPLIVRTLGSILIKSVSKEKSGSADLSIHPAFSQMHAVKLPELTEDIQLNGIEFTTVINSEQFIEQYDILIQASGKDAAGKQHELELNFQLNFSDFNQTETDVLDLENKRVEKLEPDQLFEQ
ncbi:MAG: hypothetical protein K0Q73_5644 [Paenibacillus sp.]|nr:hypothetical protein [Paenibacillus sp.]